MNTPPAPPNANETCVAGTEKAGKVSSCDGCPNQKACSSGEGLPKPEVVGLDKLSQVKHKILVLSGKGGVGKSTFASQLAFSLAREGKQVGLLDVDICGPSIPRMLGLTGQEVHQSASGWSPVYVDDNLGVMSIGFMLPNVDDAVIWRGPRKNGLIKQFLTDVDWGVLDYLIIDTPPGTSDEHISIVQYLKATSVDGAIIVTTPQEVAMADVRKEISFCKKTGINILGVVENMSSVSLPMSELKNTHSSIKLVNSRGENMTDSVLFRIQESFPEFFDLYVRTDLFAATESSSVINPKGMAAKYEIPYLGSLPMDPNMMKACEDGYSFLELYPDSMAAADFKAIIDKVVAATPDV